MDQEYDAVILGTGLKECLLAGLLAFIECHRGATITDIQQADGRQKSGIPN
ncbi:MAG: hypothetical protein ACPGZU_15480 [Ketobacter sp.]